MLHLLALMVPLGVGAAMSPLMLTQQLVVMAGSGGRRAGSGYALGTASVAAVFVAGVLVVGSSLSLPTAPRLDASLDLALGVALMTATGGLLVWRRAHRPGPARQPTARSLGPRAAYGLGLAAMGTNLTTLALLLPAAKEVAASDTGLLGRVLAAAVLVAFACLPAWSPLALVTAAPTAGARFLATTKRGIDRYGGVALLAAVGFVGVFLVVRGTVRLLGR